MSDTTSGDRAAHSEDPSTIDDASIPENDRSFLIDTPPAQVDDDAVRAHEDADDADAHDNADAARD